jgi:hypothetical protein
MNGSLVKENEFFISLLPELLKTDEGRFALVQDCKLIDIFNTRDEALQAGAKKFELGTFLVKEIKPESDVPRFFSYRVAFA